MRQKGARELERNRERAEWNKRIGDKKTVCLVPLPAYAHTECVWQEKRKRAEKTCKISMILKRVGIKRIHEAKPV